MATDKVTLAERAALADRAKNAAMRTGREAVDFAKKTGKALGRLASAVSEREKVANDLTVSGIGATAALGASILSSHIVELTGRAFDPIKNNAVYVEAAAQILGGAAGYALERKSRKERVPSLGRDMVSTASKVSVLLGVIKVARKVSPYLAKRLG